MPPRWHESACLAAQAAHHHHRGQCQPRSAPASLSFSRHHLSLSLSLSFAADRSSSTCALAHYRLRPCRGRWLRRPLCPRGCGLGGEISTEISLKSRPNVGGLQEGFFFLWITEPATSARSAPTSISPPLPPPPPPSERGCPRREEPPAGAGSRRPNSATVASTDGVLLLLESRLGAF